MIACPSLAQWQAVLSQGFSGPEEEAFSQHVLTCASCQAVLETLSRSESLPSAWLAHAAMDTPAPAQASTDTPPHSPPQDPFRTVDFPRPTAPASNGPLVPGYELLEELGRGGMGVVFKARHLELNRLVALKMLRDHTLADAGMLARFRDEARAVARLQHPGIVQIHEIGTLEGQPFLALEYVPGRSLERQLQGAPQPPRDAAALMVPLAEAIHAAHLQGILHRDLKPANVLLTFSRAPEAHASEGEARASGARLNEAVPKITDFGLAKPLDEDPRHTETGVVVGTPCYMAPEQAAGQKNLGPAVDIYALGAILYEMLTGRPPFKGVTAYDTVHLVLTTEPVPPRRLQPQVPRDLETICLKCLHKEPARRYLTAADLAADVERFLDGRPILARPAGRIERMVKWCRRYPAVAALLVVATTLAAWALTAAEGERRAKLDAQEKEKLAVAAAAAEKVARVQAEKRLAQIEKGVELFAGMLKGINPRSEEKEDKPLYDQLRERAEKAADQLQAEAVGDPLAEARLQALLGVTLHELGDAGKAVELLERARATQEAKLGANHHVTLATLNNLATAYHAVGKLPQAIALYEQVRNPFVETLGADHPDTLTTLTNLAGAYHAVGKLPQAIALLEQVRDARVKTLGADHPATLTTLNNLAGAYHTSGKLPEAIALLEQVRDATVKTLGANHHNSLGTLNNLARAYQDAGKLPEAIALLEQVKVALVKKLGAGHPNSLTAMNNLGMAYQAAGKLPEAILLIEQAAVGIEKGRFQHEYARLIIPNMIAVCEQAKQFDKAEAWRRKWLAVVKQRTGADSPAYASELAALGLNLLQQKKWTEAETALKECLALREKTHPDVWQTFNIKSMLGGTLLGQKKHAEAEPLLLAGYEGMKQREQTIPPQGRTRLLEALDRLIELYTATNKPDKVKQWQAERAKYPTVAPPREKK